MAANVLEFTGTYGNAPGCKYAADGNYSDETMIVLTPGRFETFVTLCEFLQALPVENGSRVLTMLCGHEGDSAQTIEFMRVDKIVDGTTGATAYELYSDSGDSRGKVAQCP